MRKYYYRKILVLLFFVNLIVIAAAYFKYCKNQIPSVIHIHRGTKTCLQYDVPATATVNSQTIKLNEPFVVEEEKTGHYEMQASLFGKIPLKKIHVYVSSTKKVTPSGKVIGIYVETKGLLVLETDSFTGIDGANHSPGNNKLYKGDYILTLNGKTVQTKVEFMKMINECEGNEITLMVRRKNKKIRIKVKPVMASTDHQYKIGVWVRDNTQGIGTLTYTQKSSFGGLGHGICDMDTGELMDIKGGLLLEPQIDTIVKGKSGSPGEIVGTLYYKEENLIGSIEKNTDEGIYGSLADTKSKEYPIGYKQDIKKGKAYIISDISGTKEKYEIMIRKINHAENQGTKGMEIEITDEKLLKLTNGIVQGMSGSPIIQNGKLIGAITHVFVNEPARGYGIFIENMLDNLVE
ncbi:SpoIVB peptidase [Anaerostipes faecalis]|uniref:SpoIVB peptidase n=1 Tax=Anaerostipes faecalis TaxID=2738446 RepID=UPI001C1DD398|nr:SpoIVB peptidase [Anaerostipes faecalis]